MSHAEFSPSGMKRKALCPASHTAEAVYPDRSSTAAIDGTHTHTALEFALSAGPYAYYDAGALIGMEFEDHEGKFVVDKARADRIQVALDFVKPYVEKGWTLYAEKKVNPGNLIFRGDWWGTADIILISPDTMHIVVADYKDGSMHVNPYENDQGISYLLGIVADWILLDPKIQMEFVIIQPKAMGVTTWGTTFERLTNYYLPKMVEVIEACESPNPEFVPGDEQCQFCSHKLNCEARQTMALEAANQALSHVQLPGGATQELPPSLPSIPQMSDQQLSDIKMAAPVLKGWLKDVDEESDRRVDNGGIIPNFKQVQTEGRRSWIDDVTAIFKTLTNMSADGERIWKKKELVVEKPISFAKVLGEPRLSEAQRKKIESTLLKKGKGSKKLVPVTDKGKDISPAALLAGIPELELQQPQ